MATVDRLAVAGSTIAFEVKIGPETPEVRNSSIYRATKEQIGIDLIGLFDAEPRPDSFADLIARGWSAQRRSPFEFTREYGRGPLPEAVDALNRNHWVFATT